MFKEFVERIITAENKEHALNDVFYGTYVDGKGRVVQYGIKSALHHGKITYEEYRLLQRLIERIA